VTTLTANEERLVQVLCALPPEATEKVIVWATQLRDLANGKSVDWSDTWTGEDLDDASKASLGNFDRTDLTVGDVVIAAFPVVIGPGASLPNRL